MPVWMYNTSTPSDVAAVERTGSMNQECGVLLLRHGEVDITFVL
jgi:hypothetical protein